MQGVFLSTTSSIDVQCVPLSTARSMDAQGVFLSATNSENMQGVRLYKCQTVWHPISPTKIQYAGNYSYSMFITIIAVFSLPTGNDILYIP